MHSESIKHEVDSNPNLKTVAETKVYSLNLWIQPGNNNLRLNFLYNVSNV